MMFRTLECSREWNVLVPSVTRCSIYERFCLLHSLFSCLDFDWMHVKPENSWTLCHHLMMSSPRIRVALKLGQRSVLSPVCMITFPYSVPTGYQRSFWIEEEEEEIM